MGQEILDTLSGALHTFVQTLAHFLPRVLSALALLVVGWLLAALLRLVVRKVLVWVRFDAALARLGAEPLLEKAGAPAPHRVAAALVYWLTWAAVGLAMLESLGVSGANILVADFFRFLPRLVAAVAILVVGFVLSTLAWRASILAAVNYRLQSAKLLGALVRLLVLIATVAMAFGQIGVGEGVLNMTFAILFGSIMFAVAIAFGLGGRHIARRYLEQRLLARGEDRSEDAQLHL